MTRNDRDGRPEISSIARVTVITGTLMMFTAMIAALWVGDWRLVVTGVIVLAAAIVAASVMPARD